MKSMPMLMKLKQAFVVVAVIVVFAIEARVQDPDPNFYIFLCFGQSNMEGLPGH